MKTYVTTCPQNLYLMRDFLILATKFYDDRPLNVDIAKHGEAKSDQLLRLLNSIDDEYLILMEEDFYLIEDVDLNLLDRVCEFCIENEVDRFTLQSKEVYSVSDWLDTRKTIVYSMVDGGNRVYQAPPQMKSHFGLDATVWKKSFLLSHITPGQSDWEMERVISPKIKESKIYALDLSVMNYRDAMRRGKQVIQLHTDPLRLVARNSLDLYPEGDNDSKELIL